MRQSEIIPVVTKVGWCSRKFAESQNGDRSLFVQVWQRVCLKGCYSYFLIIYNQDEIVYAVIGSNLSTIIHLFFFPGRNGRHSEIQ